MAIAVLFGTRIVFLMAQFVAKSSGKVHNSTTKKSNFYLGTAPGQFAFTL